MSEHLKAIDADSLQALVLRLERTVAGLAEAQSETGARIRNLYATKLDHAKAEQSRRQRVQA